MTTRGTVSGHLEAGVTVRVIGPAGSTDVAALIDTGFTGSLTLPEAVVASLGLVRTSRGSAFLADGSEQEFLVYRAQVDWDGSPREVLVSEVGTEVLVGMRLLAGHELRIEIVPGGAVEIRPLP